MSRIRDLVEEVAVRWSESEATAENAGETSLSREIVGDIRSSGVLAAPVPSALGGWDASLLETADALRVLARYAPSAALALSMPLGNAATTRVPEGALDASVRAAQRESSRWIADVVRQGGILAVANSEPGAHGDLSATKTTAKADGERYLLSGRKAFATLGRDADYFMCAAKRDAVVDGFFVAREAKGLVLDEKWDAWGMRSTASVGLTLDETPTACVYGHPGALTGVNARHWSTVLFAAIFTGVGEGALEQARAGLDANAVWPRAKLAEHHLALEAAWGFVQSIALVEAWPFPKSEGQRARSAKTFAARTALAAATDALALSGSRAYARGGRAAKLLTDAAAGSFLRPPLGVFMDELARGL